MNRPLSLFLFFVFRSICDVSLCSFFLSAVLVDILCAGIDIIAVFLQFFRTCKDAALCAEYGSSCMCVCLLGILAAQNLQSRCAEEQSACEQSDFSPNFFMISFLII